jgi:hypothetical protein
MGVEEVGANLVQITPPEAGTGQPHGDRLALHDVDAVATVGPTEADDVRAGVTPRHGGLGPTCGAQRPEGAAEKAGHEDGRDEKGPADAHRVLLRAPRRPGRATRP